MPADGVSLVDLAIRGTDYCGGLAHCVSIVRNCFQHQRYRYLEVSILEVSAPDIQVFACLKDFVRHKDTA
jgi:hypothetical protein